MNKVLNDWFGKPKENKDALTETDREWFVEKCVVLMIKPKTMELQNQILNRTGILPKPANIPKPEGDAITCKVSLDYLEQIVKLAKKTKNEAIIIKLWKTDYLVGFDCKTFESIIAPRLGDEC